MSELGFYYDGKDEAIIVYGGPGLTYRRIWFRPETSQIAGFYNFDNMRAMEHMTVIPADKTTYGLHDGFPKPDNDVPTFEVRASVLRKMIGCVARHHQRRCMRGVCFGIKHITASDNYHAAFTDFGTGLGRDYIVPRKFVKKLPKSGLVVLRFTDEFVFYGDNLAAKLINDAPYPDVNRVISELTDETRRTIVVHLLLKEAVEIGAFAVMANGEKLVAAVRNGLNVREIVLGNTGMNTYGAWFNPAQLLDIPSLTSASISIGAGKTCMKAISDCGVTYLVMAVGKEWFADLSGHDK